MAKVQLIGLKNMGLSEKDIIIYGESLGTGIAVQIAQNKKFAGFNIGNTFYFNG